MAYDKAVDSAALDGGLSQIANAIRKKMHLPILSPEATEWLPEQEGENDPSTTNIRPIIGRDTVNVEQADGSVIQYGLPHTVYGGSIDADGNGAKAWSIDTLTGNETWHASSSTSGAYWAYPNNATDVIEPSSTNAKYELVCDRFIAGSMAEYKANVGYVTHDMTFCFHTEFESVDEWKAYLAEQYANGTPVQIAYRMRAPAAFASEVVARMERMQFPNGMIAALEADE